MATKDIMNANFAQSWQTALSGFLTYIQLEKSLSKHSVDAYLRDVQKLIDFLVLRHELVSPENVLDEHIEALLSYLHELGLDPRSQARLLSGLKSFFKYLFLEDWITTDPTELITGPKLSRKIPDFLTIEEIQAVLDSIDLSDPLGIRNRAMLETLYASGLRVTELTTLKLSDYFPDIGFIKVIGKTNKERIVPIGDEAIKYIEQYLTHVRKTLPIKKTASDVLFLNRRGNALTRVMVFLIIKNATEAAQIDKVVSPHTFRHSFATHLIDGGASLSVVQELLGHESIITTEIYTHLSMEYLRETIQVFHPRAQQMQHKKRDKP
jgi:integrase/recombinase XerD